MKRIISCCLLLFKKPSNERFTLLYLFLKQIEFYSAAKQMVYFSFELQLNAYFSQHYVVVVRYCH